MLTGRCFLAGAGDFCGCILPDAGDYVIAADAGYDYLLSAGITPDLVVGDFDSSGVIPNHPNIVLLSEEKDDTDMMIAAKEGLSRGLKTFIIDGGLGGRFDHTFANIQLLVFLAKNGALGYLIGRDICITAVSNGSINFPQGLTGNISVFSVDGNATGVTITGLKYTLKEGCLTSGEPIGISNEFIGQSAFVTVRSGTLAVMWNDLSYFSL